jgi:hypothetical protein
MGNRALFPGVEWLGYEAGQSAPSSMQAENAWGSAFADPYIFIHCLIKRAQYYFFFQDKSVMLYDVM